MAKGWCLEAGDATGRRWLWPNTFSHSRKGPWANFLAEAGKAITDAPSKRASMKRAKTRWHVRVVPVLMSTRTHR